jgi:D-amino peptidase
MKWFILTDLEGVAGVQSWTQTYEDAPGRHPEDVTAPARYLREGDPHRDIDASFAGLLFVGQHAMAGTYHAPLCHTYSSRTIAYYRLNGVFVGEFGARALITGAAGVPTIFLFLAGDDKACLEARVFVPEIVTAETKRGRGLQAAEHLSTEASCALIREKAAEACRQAREIPPITMPGPYELEVRYLQPQEWFRRTFRAGVSATVLDDRTVLLQADDLRCLPV